MPEVANITADFEEEIYSAEMVEHEYAADLDAPWSTVDFNPTAYFADLGSSELP